MERWPLSQLTLEIVPKHALKRGLRTILFENRSPAGALPAGVKETAVGTYDELYSVNELKARSPWEPYVTLESVQTGYDDMNAIWNLMLERSGINLHDTLSGWSGGMTYKSEV